MKKCYIAWAIASLLMLNVSIVAGWTLHMEKIIKPGDTVTITCANPQVNPLVTECDSGELVVSPSTCNVPGYK